MPIIIRVILLPLRYSEAEFFAQASIRMNENVKTSEKENYAKKTKTHKKRKRDKKYQIQKV